jgi:hypothetical protein
MQNQPKIHVSESEQWVALLGVRPDSESLTLSSAHEKLAKKLAPRDLQSIPVYCVPTSILSDELRRASRHTGGWFHCHAYFWLRNFLPVDRGPGLAFVVRDFRDLTLDENLVSIAQKHLKARGEAISVEELSKELLSYMAFLFFCRTAIHELAHGLAAIASGCFQEEMEFMGELLQRSGTSQRTSDFLSNSLSRLAAKKDLQGQPPEINLTSHDSNFTRIVAHLDFRLQKVGVVSRELEETTRYGQLPYAQCFEAIREECRECESLTFRDIMRRPVSPEFARATNKP